MPAEIVAIIKGIELLLAAGVAIERMAPIFESLFSEEKITKEELDAVIAQAAVSDQNYDDYVARVKAANV